jgi:N-acetylmuramic acid 6-phosphate etherase
LLCLTLIESDVAANKFDPGSTHGYNLTMAASAKIRSRANPRMTERRDPASRNLDRMSALEIVGLMNREDRKVARAVQHELAAIARAADEIVRRIRQGGRLIYLGAGSSGRIAALDAAECPPTFGTPPRVVQALIAGGKRAMTSSVEGAEDNTAAARSDLQLIRLTRKDVLVGIAASGTTPYVLSAVAYAKERKTLTIGVTNDRKSPLAKNVDIAIVPQVGPEVLAGSTRLKAGTSQKMVLNMLSTAVMVRLGHAYDNLMIDMAQTNEKLRERAKWILNEASARNASAVTHALRHSGHDLRLALVMLKKAVPLKQARLILTKSGGNLRKALGE